MNGNKLKMGLSTLVLNLHLNMLLLQWTIQRKKKNNCVRFTNELGTCLGFLDHRAALYLYSHKAT